MRIITRSAATVLLVLMIGCARSELSRASEDIKSGLGGQRVAAAKTLGDLNDAGAVPALIPYLSDKDPVVQEAVSAAVVKHGAAAVDFLSKVVQTGGPDERKVACKALMAIGKPAYESATHLIADVNPETQLCAVRILGSIGDDRAIPLLLTRIGDSNGEVRKSGVEALGNFSEPRIFDAVLPLLQDPALREVAANTLGHSGATRVSAIGAALKGQPLEIRLALIQALAQTRSAEAVPILKQQLQQATAANYPFTPENDKIIEQTEKAMGDLGPAAVAPLIEILRKNPDVWVDSAATTALRTTTDVSTVQLVIDELLSGRQEASFSCALALSSFAGNDKDKKLAAAALAGLLTALKSEKPAVRETAAQANTHDPVPEVKQQFLSAIDRKDLAIIRGAYEFFIRQGISGSEETLIDALNSSSDMFMGEAYLNCGNEKLNKAARAWAPRHSYIVKPSSSSGILRWGAKR